ncbi:MAG: PorT family protein [Reichenbachiella sp.]
MKSIRIAIFVSLLLTAFISTAQRKTYIGFNGGLNFGTADIFHRINGYNYESQFVDGYQGGIVLMNFLPNHLGIQTGVSYVQKGWRQSFDNGEPDHSTELDFIEVPFMASIYSGKKSLHFFVSAGCFFEYRVNATVDPAPNDPGIYDFTLYDEDRDYKYGYGFKGGAGAFYDFRFGTIMLDINSSYSLSQAFKPPSIDSDIPHISSKINVGFTLGYLFSFGSFDKKD